MTRKDGVTVSDDKMISIILDMHSKINSIEQMTVANQKDIQNHTKAINTALDAQNLKIEKQEKELKCISDWKTRVTAYVVCVAAIISAAWNFFSKKG